MESVPNLKCVVLCRFPPQGPDGYPGDAGDQGERGDAGIKVQVLWTDGRMWAEAVSGDS